MTDTETLLDQLSQAVDHAEQIERENRGTGTPESKAFDAGRVSGMRDMLELVRREIQKQ